MNFVKRYWLTGMRVAAWIAIVAAALIGLLWQRQSEKPLIVVLMGAAFMLFTASFELLKRQDSK